MATRPQKEIKALHSSADYFEPLFRAAFVRAMKKVQKSTSINQVALSMATTGARTEVVPRKVIEDAVRPFVTKIIRDAMRRGGKLGAQHLTNLLNG